MTRRIRAAVIGLGAMGRHHVRILADLPSVDLVAVADVSQETVDRMARTYRVTGYSSVEELLDSEDLDMVSIVVPTVLHHQTAVTVMESGVNVLCEKPIASTVELARDMIRVSRDNAVRLMIGHIERFNPAILELRNRLDQVGDIYQISARRLGPFPDRIRDVGVVVDLASHDIDAMSFLLDSPVEMVFAQTAQRIHATNEDMILGTIRFENGVVGALDVNWLTSTKIRELMVVGSHGTFIANYLTQDLAFYANGVIEVEWTDFSDLQRISEGSAIRYAFNKTEPLRAEIGAFVDSILNDTEVPAVPESAANALATALALVQSAADSKPLVPDFVGRP